MSVSRFFLIAMGALLIGYAVFKKGFAYVGVAPLFIGEVFLGFSFFLLLAGSYSSRIFGSPLMWIIILFISWGAIRTLPYIEEFGLNAFRDAVASTAGSACGTRFIRPSPTRFRTGCCSSSFRMRATCAWSGTWLEMRAETL